MTAGQYLFGFNGRINRAKWWLLVPIQIGAWLVYYTAAATLFTTSLLSVIGTSPESAFNSVSGSGLLFVLLSIVYVLGMFVVSLAVTVKRLHDRDKSGAWILLFAFGPWVADILAFGFALGTHAGFLAGLIALAGFGITVWAFVELGCLRGTIGDNRFGPDPIIAPYFNSPQWQASPAYGTSSPGAGPVVDPFRADTSNAYSTDRVHASAAATRPAGAPTERRSLRALSSLEFSGTGQFSEYYLEIDGSELAGMANGFLIGRDSESCAFAVEDGAVSRTHAKLSIQGNDYTLEDLGSTNGTTVNGRVLAAHQPVRLRSGDEVSFGPAKFHVRFI